MEKFMIKWAPTKVYQMDIYLQELCMQERQTLNLEAQMRVVCTLEHNASILSDCNVDIY